MVLGLDALEITFKFGLSSFAESTTNKLSESEGSAVIKALAFNIPALINTSSSVALPCKCKISPSTLNFSIIIGSVSKTIKDSLCAFKVSIVF